MLLHFFLQPIHELALLDEDAVELFNLMFEVRGVGFEAFEALGNFFVHDGGVSVAQRGRFVR
ncbi:MAG: hypothetical protein RLZZ350_1735 [Verrucomicrobiota bacterium]